MCTRSIWITTAFVLWGSAVAAHVDQIVHGSFAGVASTPVFGCAL
jgi:hypothetical protein